MMNGMGGGKAKPGAPDVPEVPDLDLPPLLDPQEIPRENRNSFVRPKREHRSEEPPPNLDEADVFRPNAPVRRPPRHDSTMPPPPLAPRRAVKPSQTPPPPSAKPKPKPKQMPVQEEIVYDRKKDWRSE